MGLTLHWYSPNGTTTTVNRMEVPGFDDRGTTPGKVRALPREGDTVTRMVMVGGTERPVLNGTIHVPLSAFVGPTGLTLTVGWECVVDSCSPNDDPALVGRRYRIVEVPAKSYATARRMDAVEVT
jgi:Family of unknown function (DUF6093)